MEELVSNYHRKGFMKVLQVNTIIGRGSTGVIVLEIEKMLQKNNIESFIAYGRGDSADPHHYQIGSKIEHSIHSLVFSKILGLQGLGSIFSTLRFIRWIDNIRPDVVHLHTLHAHFVNFPILFSYLKRKSIPVVWSFFDCWPFTGKCPHFTEVQCYKWKNGCENCQHLYLGVRTYFFDRTKRLYNLKKKYCASLSKLDIIVCSSWLKWEVEQSMYGSHPIHMIYNWIDINKFKQINDPLIKGKYGVDTTKKTLISVSAYWSTNNSRLRDAIRLATILPDGYQLVIIGHLENKVQIHPKMKHIDYVHGTEDLSKLYSLALAYVNFSVEDTFGKVIAEAMLCGAPPIVFNATACPEVAGAVGFSVAPHDVEAMKEIIVRIDNLGVRKELSEKVKRYVIDNYNFENNVSQYIKIYNGIVALH